MTKLEIKLTKKPSKLKILVHYDIQVNGEFWGRAVDFQTLIDPCWRLYQQQTTGLRYVGGTGPYTLGGTFKDKQEALDYIESSPTCHKENPNTFTDNSLQPNKIRDNNTHSSHRKSNNYRSNSHKKKNSRK